MDQERIRVQIYRRRDGQWWVDSIGPGGRLRLDSVELDCPVEILYEDLSEPMTPNPRQGREELLISSPLGAQTSSATA